jgi:hypothetical protein
MRLAAILLFVVVTPLGSGVAYADSDGYYCVGPGYLAYQFGLAPPPVAPHHLYVLRFSSAAGIQEPVSIDLPQFQVHGILCDAHMVRLAGWDAIYSVQLDTTFRPIRYNLTPRSDPQHLPPEFVGASRNLGGFNRIANALKVDRVSLGSVNGGGQFLVEVKGAAVPSDRCASTVISRIVRTDRSGREIQELEVFRGRGFGDCGGLAQPDPAPQPTARASSCEIERVEVEVVRRTAGHRGSDATILETGSN